MTSAVIKHQKLLRLYRPGRSVDSASTGDFAYAKIEYLLSVGSSWPLPVSGARRHNLRFLQERPGKIHPTFLNQILNEAPMTGINGMASM